MNSNLLNIVKQIIAERGENVLADPQQLKPLFKDYAKDEPKDERVAFGRCIEIGSYQELKSAPSVNDRQRRKITLADQLVKTGIDKKHCTDALDLLEAVLFSGTQDESESILLKAMVTVKQIDPPRYGINNGYLTITNKRIVYTSSKLLNVDALGLYDTDLSFYYDEIAECKSTKYNLAFPAIEITTKDGYKILFGGYGKVKTAHEIICERMKI